MKIVQLIQAMLLVYLAGVVVISMTLLGCHLKYRKDISDSKRQELNRMAPVAIIAWPLWTLWALGTGRY